MEQVTGIGGFFFKAENPEQLSEWYQTMLGVGVPAERGKEIWMQEAGATEFAPFGKDTWESPYLGPTGWGINFRVNDLDAMVSQLRDASVEVDIDTEDYPYGRFAQLRDPEGNSIQLWELKAMT